ncbi:MAG: hypothetical protein V3T31_00750 [candidate division Zixibacteria bacterium]
MKTGGYVVDGPCARSLTTYYSIDFDLKMAKIGSTFTGAYGYSEMGSFVIFLLSRY